MRRLPFIIFGFLFSISVLSQKSPHGNQIKIDCSDCHSTGSWVVKSLTSTFDHNQTGFSLHGQHQQIDCKMCHLSLNFTEEKGQSDCASCHLDVHERILGSDCALCHTSQSWIINNVSEIHYNSRFPLVGAHDNADCFDCHLSENLLQFRPLGVECIDCHRAKYLSTSSPNHQQAGYSTDCYDCHNIRSSDWFSESFEHGFFPLTDGHANELCFSCHTAGNFQTLSPDCESCHLDNYNATLNPPHASLNFPVNCLECHTTAPGWTPARFDLHNNFYVLEGAHTSITNECISCHSAGYVNTPNTCYGCHADNYNSTNDPSHLLAGFLTDCSECHTQNAWVPSTFTHSVTFPLTQGHTVGNCLACHIQGNYGTLSSDCESCHLDNYNATLNPPHASLNFPVNCLDCHTTNPGWTPARFDLHNDFYVLEGAHATIANECISCHSAGYVNTPNTCYDCHADNYNSTNDPSHLLAGFLTDCGECHTQNAWVPSTFTHSVTFPLTQGHAVSNCLDCHIQGNYETLSPDCESCHLDNYNATINPPHASLNFPINCLDCHTTIPGWTPARFDIHNNFYVLEGAHATIANECISCHSTGYVNTPNTCYGCHADNYNNTNDPSHLTANFPIDCTLCHTQNAWIPSTFDHDVLYFPIYSGEHNGEWNSCIDCHTVASNYIVFSCIDCHEHNKTDVDDEHSGVSGYIYNSLNCLECHPNGKSD